LSSTASLESVLVVAAVQLSSQADVVANLARMKRWAGEAARAGAKVVALPENFALMGEDDTQKRGVAESVAADAHGPILTAVRDVARDNNVFVIAGGMPERTDDPLRPYNTSVVVAPTGDVVARYRKIHLFDVDFGLTICYDLRFPELYRALTRLGARVVTVPAAFTLATGKDHWHVLLRARAIENQVFILAPAQTGKHPRGRQTYGKSLIVDPWGDVLAQCGEGEGFALARLDLHAQDRVRSALPCLQHRRL